MFPKIFRPVEATVVDMYDVEGGALPDNKYINIQVGPFPRQL